MAAAFNVNRINRDPSRPDYLVDKRRAEEAERSRMLETTKYYAKASLQSTFEEQSSASMRRNAIRRRVSELKGREEDALEDKKERLRQLLIEDENRFERELVAAEETTEHRIEVMRARVKELKDRRELERKAIVEEKLMQRWRNECDDLRALESKVIVKAVTDARAAQLVEHEQRKVDEAEERKKYDALWEVERQKKIAREEADKIRQRQLNEQMLTVLGEQMAQLRSQAAKEEELKKEEAALMKAEHDAQTAEIARKRLQKEREQRMVRTELDRFNQVKIAQRAKDARESLEMDLKIVSEFLEADAQDKAAKSAKKKALRDEMLSYRDSLIAQREKAKERETEVEAKYREEEEKMWKARAEKWQREQRARDKLMQEVIQARQEQLRLQMEQLSIRQEQARLESLEIRRRIEESKAAEAAEKAAREIKREQYKETLADQVSQLQIRRDDERQRIENEIRTEKESQAAYEELLKSELQRANGFYS